MLRPASESTSTLRYAATIGDGAATSIDVEHNLGTSDVHVTVRDVATGTIYGDSQVGTTVTDDNTVTLTFISPPDADSLRVVVTG